MESWICYRSNWFTLFFSIQSSTNAQKNLNISSNQLSRLQVFPISSFLRFSQVACRRRSWRPCRQPSFFPSWSVGMVRSVGFPTWKTFRQTSNVLMLFVHMQTSLVIKSKCELTMVNPMRSDRHQLLSRTPANIAVLGPPCVGNLAEAAEACAIPRSEFKHRKFPLNHPQTWDENGWEVFLEMLNTGMRWPCNEHRCFNMFHFFSCKEHTFQQALWGKQTQADALRRAFGVCRISAKDLSSSLVWICAFACTCGMWKSRLTAFNLSQQWNVCFWWFRVVLVVKYVSTNNTLFLRCAVQLRTPLTCSFSPQFLLRKKTQVLQVMKKPCHSVYDFGMSLVTLVVCCFFSTVGSVCSDFQAKCGPFVATPPVSSRICPGWLSHHRGAGTTSAVLWITQVDLTLEVFTPNFAASLWK